MKYNFFAFSIIILALLILAGCYKSEELSVDLSDISHMNIGSEMPRLLYADDNIAVIQGTFGVIVYNMKKSLITDRISYEHLKSYDISMMRATVTQDGTTIYIGNDDMSFSNDNLYTHQYDISSRTIKEMKKKPSNMFIPKTIETPGYNKQYDKYFDLQYLTSDRIVELNNSFIYLRSLDWNVKNLQMVICQYNNGESKVFDVFKWENGTKEEEVLIQLTSGVISKRITYFLVKK